MILRNRNTTEAFALSKINADIVDISTPSYSFKRHDKESGKNALARLFGITDEVKNNFDSAYSQASSGQGGESSNLLTLHSSALLSLLCFFNVSPQYPLKVALNKYTVVFDTVFFEVENIVKFESDRNSSIDIALYSTKSNIMLLLESKFTEPTNGGKLHGIAEKYVKRLSSLEKCGIYLKSLPNTFDCEKINDHYIYYDGIKQMVAHLIGAETNPASKLSTKANKKKIEKQQEYSELYKNADKIFLGTILFIDSSFFNSTEYEMINSYVDLYRNSMQIISDTITDTRIVLITEPQTYQNIFKTQNSGFLLPNVAQFYNLE